MYDKLSGTHRLLFCLLASAAVHGGLVLSGWGEAPSHQVAARSPVTVARVEVADWERPASAQSDVQPEVIKVTPQVAPRPVAVAAQPEKTGKPQVAQIVEPKRHNAPDAVAAHVPLPSEQQVCMVPQDALASAPLEVVKDEPLESTKTVADGKPASAQVADILADSLVEAIPAYRSNPLPEYPSLARQRRWEGVVWLQVDVTFEGRVSGVRVESSSGHAILDRSARRTVGRWRFVPATHAGLPVDSRVRVPVRFRLEEG